MKYELLLKGGHMIDPCNNIDQEMDLAIAAGKIADVAVDIPITQASKVIDLTGLYVTPGLIDCHCHLYATAGNRDAWAGDNSVFPDSFSFRSGVTTMVDAGSAGWRNFEDFRNRVIDRAITRVYAMINITGFGMMSDISEQNVYDMDPKATAGKAYKHRDIVIGIKSAHYFGPEWTPVERAIDAGNLVNLPVMIDVGYFRAERPYYQLITEKLRPGDISTHMYIAPIPYIDSDGKMFKYFEVARKRGILFDVGHGGGSFVFRNAVPSIQQGFYPDMISTDLHTLSMNTGMMDMMTLMSKFLAMGIPLREVIKEVTVNPARLIINSKLGHLSVGAIADVAVLNLMYGKFGFYDAGNGKLEGDQRLVCELTIKDGRVVWDWNARMATDYREMDQSYGIRSVDRVAMPETEHLK